MINRDKPWSVNLWGSHPDAGNEDCWTGVDFDSYEEADAAFRAPSSVFSEESSSWRNWAFVQLLGPDEDDFGSDVQVELRVAQNPKWDPERARRAREDDDQDWRRERAMQAGMAFGCDGYNDAMGFDVGHDDY